MNRPSEPDVDVTRPFTGSCGVAAAIGQPENPGPPARTTRALTPPGASRTAIGRHAWAAWLVGVGVGATCLAPESAWAQTVGGYRSLAAGSSRSRSLEGREASEGAAFYDDLLRGRDRFSPALNAFPQTSPADERSRTPTPADPATRPTANQAVPPPGATAFSQEIPIPTRPAAESAVVEPVSDGWKAADSTAGRLVTLEGEGPTGAGVGFQRQTRTLLAGAPPRDTDRGPASDSPRWTPINGSSVTDPDYQQPAWAAGGTGAPAAVPRNGATAAPAPTPSVTDPSYAATPGQARANPQPNPGSIPSQPPANAPRGLPTGYNGAASSGATASSTSGGFQAAPGMTNAASQPSGQASATGRAAPAPFAQGASGQPNTYVDWNQNPSLALPPPIESRDGSGRFDGFAQPGDAARNAAGSLRQVTGTGPASSAYYDPGGMPVGQPTSMTGQPPGTVVSTPMMGSSGMTTAGGVGMANTAPTLTPQAAGQWTSASCDPATGQLVTTNQVPAGQLVLGANGQPATTASPYGQIFYARSPDDPCRLQAYVTVQPRTVVPTSYAPAGNVTADPAATPVYVAPQAAAPVTYTPVQTNVPDGPRPLIGGGRGVPDGTYVGQGIIGQPVAYVEGQPVRNFFRYIFP